MTKRKDARDSSFRVIVGGGDLEVTRGGLVVVRLPLDDVEAVKLESETEAAFSIVGHGVRGGELPTSGGPR